MSTLSRSMTSANSCWASRLILELILSGGFLVGRRRMKSRVGPCSSLKVAHLARMVDKQIPTRHIVTITAPVSTIHIAGSSGMRAGISRFSLLTLPLPFHLIWRHATNTNATVQTIHWRIHHSRWRDASRLLCLVVRAMAGFSSELDGWSINSLCLPSGSPRPDSVIPPEREKPFNSDRISPARLGLLKPSSLGDAQRASKCYLRFRLGHVKPRVRDRPLSCGDSCTECRKSSPHV